jgi:hypothetical protein
VSSSLCRIHANSSAYLVKPTILFRTEPFIVFVYQILFKLILLVMHIFSTV